MRLLKYTQVILFIVFFYSCGKKSLCRYDAIDMSLINLDNSENVISPMSHLDSVSVDSVKSKAYILQIILNEKVHNPIANKDYQESVYYKRWRNVEEFTVFTLNTFDSAHPVNSDISNYFLYDYCGSCTLTNYIITGKAKETRTKFGYKEFFKTGINLMLMKEPTNNGNYSFAVKMVFDDGTTFIDTTSIKFY